VSIKPQPKEAPDDHHHDHGHPGMGGMF